MEAECRQMGAYVIWMEAAETLPRCPGESRVATFLTDWPEKVYRDEYTNGTKQNKRFGLSRESTALHFISAGRYPIFDSRVVAALSRLMRSPVTYSVGAYMDSYCPALRTLRHKRCARSRQSAIQLRSVHRSNPRAADFCVS